MQPGSGRGRQNSRTTCGRRFKQDAVAPPRNSGVQTAKKKSRRSEGGGAHHRKENTLPGNLHHRRLLNRAAWPLGGLPRQSQTGEESPPRHAPWAMSSGSFRGFSQPLRADNSEFRSTDAQAACARVAARAPTPGVSDTWTRSSPEHRIRYSGCHAVCAVGTSFAGTPAAW